MFFVYYGKEANKNRTIIADRTKQLSFVLFCCDYPVSKQIQVGTQPDMGLSPLPIPVGQPIAGSIIMLLLPALIPYRKSCAFRLLA